MSTHPMTEGKYKLSDSGETICSCGAQVSFSSKEVFKHCSGCGNQYNKMRLGTSSFTYSGVMSRELQKLVDECIEFFFEADNVTNGAGHRQLCLVRWHSPEVSAYIDASKAKITLHSEKCSANVYTHNDGHSWSSEVRQTTFETITVELTDREIFTSSKEEIAKILKAKAKGIFNKEVTKEYYEEKREAVLNMPLNEITDVFSDFRTRKTSTRKFPKKLDEKVIKFLTEWEKVEVDCALLHVSADFVLFRPATILRRISKDGDGVVMTIKTEKGKAIVVKYSDIMKSQAPSLTDFNFKQSCGQLLFSEI